MVSAKIVVSDEHDGEIEKRLYRLKDILKEGRDSCKVTVINNTNNKTASNYSFYQLLSLEAKDSDILTVICEGEHEQEILDKILAISQIAL